MVLTTSTEMPQGAAAPPFSLPEPRTGNTVSLSDVGGQAVVVVFMCNHCPYVVHIVDALAKAAEDFAQQGVATIAISSNDVSTHPQDGPERMAQLANNKGFVFPYLYDESQQVARAYQAVCTPDIYLFDADHRLYYRGQFDASRPGQGVADGRALRDAVNALMSGQATPADTTPSVGCSIKWKAA